MNPIITHTPIPWSVDEVREDCAGQETLSICAENTGYVCGIHCAPGVLITAEDHCNAAFIAKACNAHDELLAALRGVLNHLWDTRKRDVKRDYHLMVAEAAARAAIAKAE